MNFERSVLGPNTDLYAGFTRKTRTIQDLCSIGGRGGGGGGVLAGVQIVA
jgi:hypothetical protein